MTPPASPAQPVRVCILAPSLDQVGGQARQAERLVNGLALEPSIEVGFIPHNPKLPGPLRRLQRIKYVRTIVTSLAYWLLAVTRLWRYDVIHVFSASYYSYLLSVLPILVIGKVFGKKVLLNYHSGEAEDHLKRWPRTTTPFMRRADMIVVPSSYLVDVFSRFGLKARVIHNVVDPDQYIYRERDEVRPKFLTSRLHEALYNVQCVLRAFAVIQSRYPAASLIVAGDGSLRGELEALARQLQLQHTSFVGFVAGRDMPALYDSCDVYLMATNIDNMPGSVIECLSCGLPVVTTDAGGVRYIVSHNESALIVPLNDHVALANQAMRLLEENGLATRLGRAGRESSRRYAWPTVRDQWLDAYRELTRSRLTASTAAARSEPVA